MENSTNKEVEEDLKDLDAKKDENIDVEQCENKEVEVETEVETETDEVKDEKVVDLNPALEIKKLEDKVKDLDDKNLRLKAEYANFRRRTSEEKTTIGLFANEKIMNEMLTIIDNMQRALDSATDKEDSLFKGVEMVNKQLVDTLNKFGLEEIKAEEGIEFDPNLHMAVMQEAVDGMDPNKIVLVLQRGYKLGAKVLRASMVKVSC